MLLERILLLISLQNKIGNQDKFTYLGNRRILYMPTSNCYYVWTVALIWSVQLLLTMSDYWIKLFPLLLLIEEEHICMKLQNWWYLENIIFTWNVVFVNLYYQGANTAWSHSSLPPYIIFYIICYLLSIIFQEDQSSSKIIKSLLPILSPDSMQHN